MRIFNSAVSGWYAIRETGHFLNAAGPSVPLFEYLHDDGTWKTDVQYFETRDELLAILEGD